MSKTIFCDIDGCIINQPQNFLDNYNKIYIDKSRIIEGSKQKLFEWYCQGFRIILTTGRPEQEKSKLIDLFLQEGVYYHQLIMDCGSGPRYLINDREPGKLTNKAFAINLDRNNGIGEVDLQKDSAS